MAKKMFNISVPTIIDHTGAKEIVEMNLTKEELEEFKLSCAQMRFFYKDL